MRRASAIIILLLFQWSACEKVLFVAPTLFETHWLYQSLYKGLSLRGHLVTAITTNLINDDELTNLTEIDISYLNIKLQKQYEEYRKELKVASACEKHELEATLVSNVSVDVFGHSKVKRFLEKNDQYDVCIIDLQYPAMLGFAAKYNCAIIGIYSSKSNLFVENAIGDDAQIFFHNLNELMKRNSSFMDRLLFTLRHVYAKLYFQMKLLPNEEAIARKYLGVDVDLLNLAHNVNLVFSNVHPILDDNNPNMLAIKKIGGSNKREYDFIPRGIAIFLNYTQTGIVYFGLDSIKSVDLPASVKDTLIEAFSKLPYDVIWKYEGRTIPNHPVNVYITDWVPQFEMMSHPSIKLFITQGTIQSVEDAINRHVPIIGMPIEVEDEIVVDECVKRGIGKKIDFNKLSQKNLNEIIIEVIENRMYKENVEKLEKVVHDKPIDDLDSAIWWTEYVMRHKNNKLHNEIEFNWYQYLLLDVVIFIISIVLFVLYALLRIVLWIIKLLFRKRINKNKKTQ